MAAGMMYADSESLEESTPQLLSAMWREAIWGGPVDSPSPPRAYGASKEIEVFHSDIGRGNCNYMTALSHFGGKTIWMLLVTFFAIFVWMLFVTVAPYNADGYTKVIDVTHCVQRHMNEWFSMISPFSIELSWDNCPKTWDGKVSLSCCYRALNWFWKF